MSELTKKETMEIVALILAASWHVLKTYEKGNRETAPAKEACDQIERLADMLGLSLDGVP